MAAGKITIKTGTAPATPSSGYVTLYPKSDKHLYYKNDAGVEFPVGPSVPVVLSVNGQTGTVLLDTDDIPEGSTNLYFTAARARLALSATSPILYDNTTGVISLSTVPINLGGSGQVTANAALNAFLPSQATNAGKFLQTDGSDTSWQNVVSGINQLTGDVTAGPGTGSVAATVAFVGGSTAADVNSTVLDVAGATAADIANTLVRRDASGNFAAGVINASILGTASNITGVLAIANGGSGQSNQQAAINNLTDITSHSDGDVFQLLSGNAQFAPLSVPGLTGTPNTLTYYDPSGDIGSLPQWAVDPTLQSLSYFANDITGGTVKLLDLSGQLQNFPDIVTNDLNVFSSNISNEGQVGGNFRFLSGYIAGGGTLQDVQLASLVIQSNSVTNQLQLLNIQENVNTVDSFIGIQLGSTSVATNGKSGLSIGLQGGAGQTTFGTQLNASNYVGGNGFTWHNVNADNTVAITGNFSVLNSTFSGTSDNVSILFHNQQGAVTNSFTGSNIGVSANLGSGTDYFAGYQINFGGGMTGLTWDGNAEGFSLTTASGNNFTGRINGININHNATSTDFGGVAIFHNSNVTNESRGVYANLQGNSRTRQGVDIYMQGNATDDVAGLRVSVQNQTSTNQRVRSMDITGATWSFNNTYRPASGLFVDSGNNNFTEFRIANGSPITNTDVLMNNNIVAYLAEDDMALGPVGLGVANLNSISLLGVADTKQIDLIRGFLVVASVQNPGYADAGTVDKYQGIVYAGALAGGGNTAVNEAIGLYMPTGFDGYATANWGILIEGSTAENSLNKLAISTSDNKVYSDSLLGLGDQTLISGDIHSNIRNVRDRTDPTIYAVDAASASLIRGTFTDNSATAIVGIHNTSKVTVASGKSIGGLAGIFNTVGRADSGDDGNAPFVFGVLTNFASGNSTTKTTDLYASYFAGFHSIDSNANQITAMYDFYAQASSIGAGAVTNRYGVVIEPDSGYTKTNWISGLLQVGGSSLAPPTETLEVYDGQVSIKTVGKGLSVAEGSNAKMGTATLVAGTVTVSTTAVTSNSRILLTNQTAGGSIGVTYIANVVAGTSFDIVSTNPADTSTIAWFIVEPA